MPRPPKKPFVAPPSPDSDEEAPAPSEQQAEVFADDSVQKIFELLKSMNLSGGKVRIYLKRPSVLKSGYVGDMTVEQFREDGMETLKRMYGGGDYSLQFADAEGQIITQTSFTIDPRFKGEIDTEPKTAPVEKPDDTRLAAALENLKPAQADTNMMPLMITLITESQKTVAQMMSANQQSTNAILTGLMSAITAMQEKKATDPALLELIRQKTEKTPIAETLEAIATLRDLTLDSPKKEEDMVEKLVKLLGPPLMAMLTSRQGGMQQLPMAVAAAPQPAQQPGGPDQGVAPPVAGESTTEPKLAVFIPMLLNAARKGTPPDAYYDVIVDNITADQFDQLIAELEKDTWFATLFGAHAEVTAQRAWFDKLRAAFLETEEEDQPPVPQESKA